MARLSRRDFLKTGAVSSFALLNGCQPLFGKAASKAHVVVVGGGFGGATAAKYIRYFDPTIRVTLIEPKTKYITCPASNWLFAGLTTLDQLSVDYQQLKNHGIEVVCDRVVQINSEKRSITLSNQQSINYDRLVLSPGIDFRWDSLHGFNQALSQRFPHAWQAGPQTELLNQQLQAMPNNGTVLICAPPDPYRCPPGPYERASMMAYWLKQHKPRAKIIILDPKRSFSKQALFEAGWKQHYGYGSENSLIEWISLADNPLVSLDAERKTLTTEFGDRFSGDVLNIIPPQTAGKIAIESGLSNSSGWCPIQSISAESSLLPFIHVIGDAGHYAPIPKSAFAANSEAKACALAIVSLLNQQAISAPTWLNTCYSLITPDHGISVANGYQVNADNSITAIKSAGGVSQKTDPASLALEAIYTQSAYFNLRTDCFD
jgi:sulfide dehydrogenase [flavocytochrome c] flavoprotein subunit